MTKADIQAALDAAAMATWNVTAQTATPRFAQYEDEVATLPPCSDLAIVNQGTGDGEGATAYIVNRHLEAIAVEVGQTIELGRNGRLNELKIIATGTLVQTVYYE